MDRALWLASHKQELRDAEHIGVGSRCGICNDLFERDDWFLCLLNDKPHPRCLRPERYSVCLTPQIIYTRQEEEKILSKFCFNENCRKCVGSPEGSAVHLDCFKLLKNELVAEKNGENYWLHALWIITAWRRPWRRCATLEFPAEPCYSIGDIDRKTLTQLGIAPMQKLPCEIVNIIHKQCPTSLFWRYCKVRDLLPFLISVSKDSFRNARYGTPIECILEWRRGQAPLLKSPYNDIPAVRLTVDSWGLKRIERTQQVPTSPCVIPRKDVKYFNSAHGEFDKMKVDYMLGMARIRPFNGLIHAWDIPCGPEACSHEVFSPRRAGNNQFSTIPLAGTTGITFFTNAGWISGFHCHTSRDASAQRTFELLRLPKPDEWSWVFMPISNNDEVISFGAYYEKPIKISPMGLMFYLKLAGPVFIPGFVQKPLFRRVWLDGKLPRALSCDMSGPRNSVRAIGAWFPDQQPHDYQVSPDFVKCNDWPKISDDIDGMFSYASLKRVNEISVFLREDSHCWAGVLLNYENGGQRALGQCRLGTHRVERHARPTHLCVPLSAGNYLHETATWRFLLHDTETSLVEFVVDTEHSCSERWRCIPLNGWFEYSRSHLLGECFFIKHKRGQGTVSSEPHDNDDGVDGDDGYVDDDDGDDDEVLY